jgi:hypothetical protein
MLVARSRINVALPPDFWKSCHDIVQSHCQNGRRSSSYKVYPNLWRSRQSMCRLIHSEKLHAKYSLYPGSAKVRPRNWMSYCYQGPGKIHQCNHRNEHGGPCQNHHAAILFLRDALIRKARVSARSVAVLLLRSWRNIAVRVNARAYRLAFANCESTCSCLSATAPPFATKTLPRS